MGQFIDRVGRRYGKLTVVSRAPNKERVVYWNVLCDCGVTKCMTSGNLTRTLTRSCGCLKKERLRSMARAQRKSKGVAGFNQLYSHYKHRAIKRFGFFGLDEKTFRDITSSNCTYCNSEPRTVSGTYEASQYTYNGVDRVDSDIGYDIDNCVPCCWTCNRMKVDIPLDSFKGHIARIHKHLNGDTHG